MDTGSPYCHIWTTAGGREKADANLRKHKISFEAATEIFADPALVVLDATRDAENEVRLKAIGRIEGRLFTVVYTMRDGTTCIISARRSNKREEEAYG